MLKIMSKIFWDDQLSRKCYEAGLVDQLISRLGAAYLAEESHVQPLELMQRVTIVSNPGYVNPTQNPQDMTTWKKGSKNKIISLFFKDDFYYEAVLEMKLERPVEMHSVRIGLIAYSMDGEVSLTTPSAVSLDYYLDDPLLVQNVALKPFNDDGYLMFCVKLFTHNFMAGSGSPRPARAQFLRLRFRRPMLVFTEELSPQVKHYCNLGCGVSFVSIKGLHHTPELFSRQAVAITKYYTDTYLHVLNHLCNSAQADTLARIARDQAVVSAFEQKLDSDLFGLVEGLPELKGILVRFSQHNPRFGDQLFLRLLDSFYMPSCVELLVRIVICDPCKAFNRLARTYAKAMECFSAAVREANIIHISAISFLGELCSLIRNCRDLLLATNGKVEGYELASDE